MARRVTPATFKTYEAAVRAMKRYSEEDCVSA